jgi:hypothetical protein
MRQSTIVSAAVRLRKTQIAHALKKMEAAPRMPKRLRGSWYRRASESRATTAARNVRSLGTTKTGIPRVETFGAPACHAHNTTTAAPSATVERVIHTSRTCRIPSKCSATKRKISVPGRKKTLSRTLRPTSADTIVDNPTLVRKTSTETMISDHDEERSRGMNAIARTLINASMIKGIFHGNGATNPMM